jgi:hypothetical protein
MTTLENINDTIEIKICLLENIYTKINIFMSNVETGIQNEYIKASMSLEDKNCVDNKLLSCFNALRNNILILNSKKIKSFDLIEEYSIISAMFLNDYKKAICEEERNNNSCKVRIDSIYLENIYNSKIFNNEIEGVLDYADILELRDIFYKCHYTYQTYKIPKSVTSKQRTKKIYDNYIIFISKSNIIDNLDKFIDFIYNFVKVYSTTKYLYYNEEFTLKEIYINIDKYKKIHVPLSKNYEDMYDVCECGNKMLIQSNTSELLCVRCGFVTSLIGSVTEENQLFAQEGNRVAHGSYDPTRHCKFWIERIQAKESTVIPQQYLEKIIKSIKKDKIENLKSISVKQFRAYLKQNNLSKLNDHIPLIKKIITGFIPPQLNHGEQQLLFIYFDKATKTYETIKPPNKKNSLYYPFLIYKILDLIIKDKLKKNGLLSCIHLQSYETLIDNDKIWKKICENNDCFSYKPTDKSFI